MPAKSHDSSRTTAEWLVGAKNKGFDEIEETNADKATPGKVVKLCHFRMPTKNFGTRAAK
jgi:hypothetical protein